MLLVLLVTVPVVVQADTWQETYDAWASNLVCMGSVFPFREIIMLAVHSESRRDNCVFCDACRNQDGKSRRTTVGGGATARCPTSPTFRVSYSPKLYQ